MGEGSRHGKWEHFGAIFGLTFAAYGFIAGPLGPALAGHLLDLNGGDFVPVFLYLGAFSLLAALSIRQVVPPQDY
jgi:OFA family oxalate/formate antiporter-like MFS transporter